MRTNIVRMSAGAGMRGGVIRRRGIVALLALVLLSVLLSAAAAAYAAEVVISYKDPKGGTTTETDGTTTYEGSRATQIEGVSIYRDETKEFKDEDGLTCEPANAEHQCDELDLFSNNATVEAVAPCVYYFGYFCPDADFYVANMGKGFGNNFSLGGSLEYERATLTAGSGNAEISGTPSPSEYGYPDEDIITGGSEGSDHLYGGPGNDTIYGGAANSTIDGGAGNDTIYADSGNDAINGGPGNDTIYGGTGNSYIFGGPGNDLEVGGSGTDLLGWSAFGLPETGEPDKGENTFEGTGGNTIVSFEYAKGPVTVSLDGVANDGENEGVQTQKDNVEPGIAELRGSEYNDILTAGVAPVILNGEGGNDTIYGGPGGDTLIGGEGNDTISTKGPAGDGPDQIFAGVPGCALDECPGGNDTIYAADGIADQISCDAGADILYADQLDVIANSVNAPCSSVHRETVATSGGTGGGAGGGGAGGGGGGGGVPIAPIVFSVLKAPHNVKTLLKSGLTVSTSCPAACSLSTKATISAANAKKAHITAAGKSVVVGTGHATLLAAGAVKIKINLTSKAKRDLKRLGRFTITISITAKNAAGATTTTTKTITI